LFFSVNERISPSGYGNPDLNFSDINNKFVSNEAGVQLKIWPGEKFTESFVGLISLGSKAPCFYLNYTHTLPVEINGYENSFAFDKALLDIRSVFECEFVFFRRYVCICHACALSSLSISISIFKL
jgi:hypothetical protein